MKKYLLLSLVILMAMSACNNKKMKPVTENGLNQAWMDATCDPRQDFYQYATGGWQKLFPLPAEYGRYGSFDQLSENVQKQLKDLVDTLGVATYERGSVEQKISDLYKQVMDSVRLNAEGTTPLAKDLLAVKALRNKQEALSCMVEMNKRGSDPLFSLYVGADDMNSEMNILQTYQGGLGMGDRDYYLKDDARNRDIRVRYADHLIKMFTLAGYQPSEAKTASADVMALETRLAKASFSRVELRDPYKNYHKMSIRQLSEMAPEFDWTGYFEALGVHADSINVSQDGFIREAAKAFAETPMPALRNYLAWNLINGAADCLGDVMAEQNFEFYGRVMSGREQMQPRWKRAVGVLNGSLGEALGIAYVNKYFPPQAKERMLELVGNLQESLGERIDQLAWMSDETKARAHEKLASFRVKIGYPDKWKDYSSLQIDPKMSLYENMKQVGTFYFQDNISKIGQPVDRDEWLMRPQTVNAYYNPTTNEICFPAGILQPPFFFQGGDDAVNYGAIGVVIGHEMTHGFDDQGCQYDSRGNLSNWWTEDDARQFAERTDVLRKYFDNIEVLPGLHANGSLTLGENIADHGGLQVAYNALQKTPQAKQQVAIDGFTPAQRFFIAYAHVWAGNIREQEIVRRTNEDPHALGMWRVNGTLPHISAFAEAFNLQPGDAMYLPVEERVSIW
ncbi:MAG: M13 family metallopeptidase [Bacteroidales bacterium]|nr:M13 family metallopeptidase [Bacteroidales bacterium]